jgi:predicted nucleic acid-binding protein
VVREDGHSGALVLLERSLAVVTPDLVFAEAANVVWKKLRRGELTLPASKRTRRAKPYRNFSPFPSSETRCASPGRLDHPAYDCLYLALRRKRGNEARNGRPAVLLAYCARMAWIASLYLWKKLAPPRKTPNSTEAFWEIDHGRIHSAQELACH